MKGREEVVGDGEEKDKGKGRGSSRWGGEGKREGKK